MSHTVLISLLYTSNTARTHYGRCLTSHIGTKKLLDNGSACATLKGASLGTAGRKGPNMFIAVEWYKLSRQEALAAERYFERLRRWPWGLSLRAVNYLKTLGYRVRDNESIPFHRLNRIAGR